MNVVEAGLIHGGEVVAPDSYDGHSGLFTLKTTILEDL